MLAAAMAWALQFRLLQKAIDPRQLVAALLLLLISLFEFPIALRFERWGFVTSGWLFLSGLVFLMTGTLGACVAGFLIIRDLIKKSR